MKQYTIKAKFRLPLGFYTGAGEYSEITDNPLLVDENGKPYLPGSSIAGALRSQMERIAPFVFGEKYIKCKRHDKESSKQACNCQVCRLMGTAKAEGTKEGEASRLIISSSWAESPDTPEIRDRVGIDRDSKILTRRK